MPCFWSSSKKKNTGLFWLFFRAIIAVICSFLLLTPTLGKMTLSLGSQAILATFVQIFSAWPLYINMIRAFKNHKLSMEVLSILGITAAYFYLFSMTPYRTGHFFLSSILIVLILIVKIIEEKSKEIAEIQWQVFLRMRPQTARVQREDVLLEIPIEQLQEGDLFLVRPHEKIPADGEVIEGSCAVDESMLTGHIGVVEKEKGSKIFAATINQHGILLAQATNVGKHTVFSHSLQALQHASHSNGLIGNFADKISQIFIPIILIIASLTWIFWAVFAQNTIAGFLHALTILIIAYPSAFVLPISLNFLKAYSEAMREGIFIKNASTIEKIQKMKVLFIAKSVVAKEAFSIDKIYVDTEYFPIIKTLAKHSKQIESQAIFSFFEKEMVLPYMRAFRPVSDKGISGYFEGQKYFLGSPQFFEEQGISLDFFKEILENEMGSLVLFGTEKVLIGYFILSEQIKEESASDVLTLKNLKITPIFFSKDSRKIVREIARTLTFDEYESEVLPQDAVYLIEKAKKEKEIVGVIGNIEEDALAFSAADIGFSTVEETDKGLEFSSVGLRNFYIKDVVKTIKMSKETYRNTKRYLIGAFVLNILGVFFAAFGYLTPILAGVIVIFYSLFAILRITYPYYKCIKVSLLKNVNYKAFQ